MDLFLRFTPLSIEEPFLCTNRSSHQHCPLPHKLSCNLLKSDLVFAEEGMNPASEDDFFTSLGSRGEIKTARSDEQEFEDSYAMRPSLYK